MERLGKFEHFRWVGDKRTQIVYDVDNLTDENYFQGGFSNTRAATDQYNGAMNNAST